MARLKALPSLAIIRSFKGLIDFVIWRGVPYARAWPKKPRLPRSIPSQQAAAVWGLIVQNYRLLADTALAAFQEAAIGQPRTARDLYITAVYGYLHEASMSDFLTLLTNCRDSLLALERLLGALASEATDSLIVHVATSALPTGAATAAKQDTQTTALQLIDDLRNALGSVNTDDLQVDVKTSALPTGAATAAKQDTQTASLQLMDDLQAALHSVNTDELVMRGENQLFSYKEPLFDYREAVVSSADGYLDSNSPGAGLIWKVTNIRSTDNTTATTDHRHHARHAGTSYPFHGVLAPLAVGQGAFYHGELWLEAGDFIRVHFIGSAAADTCRIDLTGYVMTKEA